MSEAGVNWEERARAIQRQDKFNLTSMEGAWVARRKFTVEAQELIAGSRDTIRLNADGTVPEDIKPGQIAAFHRLVLRYGVADHNFVTKDGKPEDFKNEEFLTRLLQYPEVEQEIFEAITEFNRPLASGSRPPSETPPSGT